MSTRFTRRPNCLYLWFVLSCLLQIFREYNGPLLSNKDALTMADEDRRAISWARRYHKNDLANTLQGTRRIAYKLNALDDDFANLDGGKTLMNAITKGNLNARQLLKWDKAEQEGPQKREQSFKDHPENTHNLGPFLRFSVPRASRPELDADSLLRLACTTGNCEAAAKALARGAHVNGCKGRAPGGPYDPPICLAVAGEHVDLVVFLIKEGRARVQRPNLLGIYPIVAATQAGNAELVEVLCRTGKAKASRRCPNGATPLIMACRAGHIEVVRVLLKLGSTTELSGIEGETCLIHACRNKHTEIAQILILRGVDVNTPLRQAKFGRCRLPIHEACASGMQVIVRSIVRIIMSNDDDDGLDLKESTLRKFFLMRTVDNGGMTPFGLAAAGGHVRCLHELYDMLPDALVEELLIHPSKEHGRTPLGFAAEGGHLKVISLMLRQGGTSTRIKDKLGFDALSLAGMHGHTEVVRMLRSYEVKQVVENEK